MPAELSSKLLVGLAVFVVACAGVVAVLRLGFGLDPTRYLEVSAAAAGLADLVLLVIAFAFGRRGHGRRRVSALARQESGFALVMALGMTTVMIIMITTVTIYTTSNLRAATDSSQRTIAYQVAERGMNSALAYLYNNPAQWHASSPINSGSVSAGTGLSYSYTLTPNFPIWTLKAVGTAANKTQGVGKPDTRTLTKQVLVTSSSGSVNIGVWNDFMSAQPAGAPNQCMHWNAIVEVPMYVAGDVCVDGGGDSDAITGWPPASLPGTPQFTVVGHIYLTPPGHLGWSGNHLKSVQTGIGCAQYNSGSPGATHNPCNTGDNVWADTYLTGPVTPLPKPVVDLATWYKDSLPGPQHNCTSGTFPGGFDGDTLQNNSLGTVNLTPASAYDCKFTDGNGNLDGEVKWTPGSPGTLLVNGTVFWDGNLVVSSSFNYTGRATFYFGGTITLNSGVSICGYAACSNSWDTSVNMLVMIAGSGNLSPSWAINMAATSKMQGAMEAVGDVTQNNGATMAGGLIANQIYGLSGNDTWKSFAAPTPGQPGTAAPTETLGTVAGSFSG